MAKIPEGASRIRNVKGEVIGYTLKGKKHYFDKNSRPVEPNSGRSLVYSTGEKGKNPIKRSHGGAGADWSKLMTKKSTSADERPPEPQKNTEPEKRTESETRTLTNNNRGGGGGNNTPTRTPTRTPPRNNSSSTPSRPKSTGQGSQGFRMKRDLGKELKISTSGKTESKPKSRLEKATSGIGKWEEPEKKKRTPNKKNRSKWRR